MRRPSAPASSASLRPAAGLHLLRRIVARHRRRRALGRHRRAAQGPHRRPRGDRHDHAQLRRALPGRLPAAHPGLAAGPGPGQPEVAGDAETRGLPPTCSAQRTASTSGFVLALARHGRSSGGCSTARALGFRFRAVGENPHAARVGRHQRQAHATSWRWSSRAPCRPRRRRQVLGTVTAGFTAGIDAGIGFDAITVALLGRSSPWGIVRRRPAVRRAARPAATPCRPPAAPDRHRARHPVAHRAVHRRAAAGPRDLPAPGAAPAPPAAREGGGRLMATHRAAPRGSPPSRRTRAPSSPRPAGRRRSPSPSCHGAAASASSASRSPRPATPRSGFGADR